MKVVELADINSAFDDMINGILNDPSYIQSQNAKDIGDYMIDNLNLLKSIISNRAVDVSARRYKSE